MNVFSNKQYLCRLTSIFLIVFTMGFTLWTVHIADQQNKDRLRTHFEYRKYHILTEFNRIFDSYYQYFVSVVGLYKSSEDVTQEEWDNFLLEIKVSGNYPSIDKIAFARWDPQIEEVRIDRITSDKGDFSHLAEGDLWQNPSIRLAMEESFKKDTGIAFADIPFFKNESGSLFFVSFPIIKQDHFLGFIIGTLDVKNILEQMVSVSHGNHDMEVGIYNGLHLIAGKDTLIQPQKEMFFLSNYNHIHDSITLDAFGSSFTVALATNNEFGYDLKSNKPVLVLLLGSFITLLLLFTFTTNFYITQKIKTDLQLKMSLLKLILQYCPIPIAILDKKLRYIESSVAWKNEFGFVPNDDEYPSLSNSTVSIQEQKSEWLEYYQRALKGEVIKAEEDSFVCKNGEKRYYSYEIRPWKDNDSLIDGLFISKQNVTEKVYTQNLLQESQEKFKAVFDNAPIGMSIISLDGRWIRVNHRFLDIIGYQESDLLSYHIDEFTNQKDVHKNHQMMEALLKGEENVIAMHSNYISISQEKIPVVVYLSLIRNNHHQPLYFIAQVESREDNVSKIS